jgi:hypothetical protein
MGVAANAFNGCTEPRGTTAGAFGFSKIFTSSPGAM